MLPTIVIPLRAPDERSTVSETTISYTPASVCSSITVSPISDGSDSQRGVIYYDNESMSDCDLSAYKHQYPFQRQHEGLLRVPEPAKIVSKRQPSTVATTAMNVTRPLWSPEDDHLNYSPASISADSLMGPLMGDDYISQFERERALARNKGMFTTNVSGFLSIPTSAGSLATTVYQGAVSTRTIQGKFVDFVEPSYKDEDKNKDEVKNRHVECPRTMDTGNRTSRTFNLFGLFSAGDNGRNRHARQMSGQSDISETLQLPKPSRFERMCSGRGTISTTCMVLIMCGLVLLGLGYPIAASLRKDRLVEEAAASATRSNGNNNRVEPGQVHDGLIV
ncbi:hypothetical protein BGZ65_007331 [Modicella reniformis]|uniref:Transmembrane protein n=1 Tax=Modicella reniformis TaxID=1440133 RepID=A0A9P6SQ16_9FUNG|nr:hypothetical protein BGZ65_007331 [Modicella reniformis]